MSTHAMPLKGPSQPSTFVNFEMPRGACDCLTHIYGDHTHFPMSAARTYTPELASLEKIESLHRALQIDRVVIVQPTLYGTDNSCTLDAIRRLGSRARGIAVIDENTSVSMMEAMADGGMRGIRINFETIGLTDPTAARHRFKLAMELVRNRAGWHIEVYTRPPILEAISDLFVDCSVPIVLDHFAGIKAAEKLSESNFELLLSLLQEGKVYVKLSAPYLASQQVPDFGDLASLAKTLIASNRERILWGTNWPHPNSTRAEGQKNTDISPLRQIDDGHILNLLPLWAPNAVDRKAILVDNPARLYGF